MILQERGHWKRSEMNGIFIDRDSFGFHVGFHPHDDFVIYRNFHFADISQQNEKSVGRVGFARHYIWFYFLTMYNDT